jgi:hypothetical protein
MYRNIAVCFALVLLPGIGAGPAAANIATGLLVHYTLDDADLDGGVVRDVSGSGNNGTIIGTDVVTGVAGVINEAFAFPGNGTRNCVQLAAGVAPVGKRPRTFCLWFNPFQINNQSKMFGYGLRSAGNAMDVAVEAGGIRIYHWGGNILYGGPFDFGGADVGFHHLAVRVNEGAQTFEDVDVFINGQQQPIDSGAATVAIDTGDSPVVFGCGENNANYNGLLDDIYVYDRALTQEEIELVMVGKPLGLPFDPIPADGANDVSRDVILSWAPGEYAARHDVYLGTDLDDVNGATPADASYKGRQDVNRFDPGRLTLGETYYWRIDEVNAPPDSTVYKGPIWNFQVEPVSYVVPTGTVSATASSATPEQDPDNTVNGSGLDENDRHSDRQEHMWLTDSADPDAWIQYEFQQVLKLDKVHVWNHNSQTEAILGFGIKEALITSSTDGETWSELGTVALVQATGATDYTGTAVSLNGIVARFVRITGLSNYSMLGLPQKGLAEVRFYAIPILAREPVPINGSTSDGVDIILQWRAGREAVEHEVVFGTDEQAVIDGSAVVATVSASSYDPGPLDLGTAYFWKINEMNDLGTPASYEGDLWAFTTPDHLMIDDMEMYRAEEGLFIWEHWIDGFDNPHENGSVVGNDDDAEKAIVYEGSQSLPMIYNNTTAPISEATIFFDTPVDLTVGNPESLKLQVRGDAPGFVDHGDGTFTVGAAGVDIWGTADDFRFVYKRLSGDGSITARVNSVLDVQEWTKAGLMIRENLSVDSTNAISFVTPQGRVGSQWRVDAFSTTVSTRSQNNGTITLPTWVRVTRTGNLFTGEHSMDGVTWLPMVREDLPDEPTEREIFMIPDVYIGLAVTSHVTGRSTVAVFSDVTTTGNVTGPWISEAIGADTHPNNDAAPMYVTMADTTGQTKTFDHPDPQATLLTDWDEWTIPLADLSPVNPARLGAITLGVGGSGVEGKVYIDAIRTHRSAAP